MLARLRRLSPSARLAWALWGIALSGAAGLLLAASAAGAAEAPADDMTITLSAGDIALAALLLSIAALCVAASKGGARPPDRPHRPAARPDSDRRP